MHVSRYPTTPRPVIKQLSQIYERDRGRAVRAKHKKGGKKKGGKKKGDNAAGDVLKVLVRLFGRAGKKSFFSFAVDEAHDLRNPVALWTIAAALTSMHAHRAVMVTGTPFNNRNQDMATMMALIDPRAMTSTSLSDHLSRFSQTSTPRTRRTM